MKTQIRQQVETNENFPKSMLSEHVLNRDLECMSVVVDQRRSSEVTGVVEDAVILENMPMVRYIARRIAERLPKSVDVEDLTSAGVLGLIDACSKFESTKQVQFRSYAHFRIQGAILDFLRQTDWSPRDLRKKSRTIQNAVRVLTQRLGRAPSEDEVSTELNVQLDEYQHLLGELRGLEIGSLHAEWGEDTGEEEIAYVAGPAQEDPLFCCLKGELRQHLTEAIEELPERERLILTLYYFEELTMKEIGQTIGVVESRVSQIHTSAVLRLRSALETFGAKTQPEGKAKGAKVGAKRLASSLC